MQPLVRSLLSHPKKVLRYSWQRRSQVENCFITCTGKTDGIGAQIQAQLSTILYADHVGIKYAHTPLQKVAHNLHQDRFWEAKWEDFFRLGAGEIAAASLPGSLLCESCESTEHLRKRSNSLIFVPHCHDFVRFTSASFAQVQPRIRNRYEAGSRRRMRSDSQPGKVHVAVHVRRGDVSNTNEPERFTTNDDIAKTTQQLVCAIRALGKTPSIHLYSEGSAAQFGQLRDLNVQLHLNDCTFTTMKNLIDADVLLMAKSSFSYVAGLYSRGVVLYPPHWNPPLQDWLRLRSDASVDHRDLLAALSRSLIDD